MSRHKEPESRLFMTKTSNNLVRRSNLLRHLQLITIITVIVAIVSLLGGCASPNEAMRRMQGNVMMIDRAYIVSDWDGFSLDKPNVPKVLLEPDQRQRIEWFFGHAVHVEDTVLVKKRTFMWMLGQLGVKEIDNETR